MGFQAELFLKCSEQIGQGVRTRRRGPIGALGRGSARKLEFVRPPVEREIVAVRKTGLIGNGAVEHAQLQLAREASHGDTAESHSSQTLRADPSPVGGILHHLDAGWPILADANRIHRYLALLRMEGKAESALQQIP